MSFRALKTNRAFCPHALFLVLTPITGLERLPSNSFAMDQVNREQGASLTVTSFTRELQKTNRLEENHRNKSLASSLDA